MSGNKNDMSIQAVKGRVVGYRRDAFTLLVIDLLVMLFSVSEGDTPVIWVSAVLSLWALYWVWYFDKGIKRLDKWIKDGRK